MHLRSDFIIPALAFLFFLGLLSSAYGADNKFNLKEGAKGKNCLNCHDSFEEILKKPFLHTPLKKWDCTGCHNPHASRHGKFLDAEAGEICQSCHAKILPENAVSSHKVAADGTCVKCHDPHAAKYKFNLHSNGKALCFECHKELGSKVEAAKYKHMPVEKGCVSCHDPHASTGGLTLLKDNVPGLCLKCHDTSKLVFQKQHGGYPVEGARCTSCHDPHGSNQTGRLYDKVHVPFGKKQCKRCHEESTAAEPFKTKAEGYKLCLGCHSNMINENMAKNQMHWPMLDRVGCLNCHTPHASAQDGLLKKPMTEVCAQCHGDTVHRLRTVETKQSPVTEGMCTSCHSPHAANQVLLLKEPSVIDLCASCHDWQKHSSHPIGADYTDPRNENLAVNCLSCHRSHGTPYGKMLHAPSQTEMCTTCHSAFKR
ncbi:MAG: cytochrome c3 family protein [Deltaproteobacteria bacterium]|jgi:predicted CXXCH cytochrome family protein|nr:cytochrome c3 family protein [Deltaproteobacteria bacterium]